MKLVHVKSKLVAFRDTFIVECYQRIFARAFAYFVVEIYIV